jgi:uncharacterized membrane protein YwzB
VTTRQVLYAAVVLGLVCAAVVWWLEGFNRDRLIRDFKATLDSLPTFNGETPNA